MDKIVKGQGFLTVLAGAGGDRGRGWGVSLLLGYFPLVDHVIPVFFNDFQRFHRTVAAAALALV